MAQLGELLLLPHHLELELSQALEPRELLCERLDSLLEVLIMTLEDLCVLCDVQMVVDLLERDHAPLIIRSRADDKIFFAHRRRCERHLAHELAALQEQLELGPCQ